MTKNIHMKRAYDKASKQDGVRILVDRIWPRGVSKEEADLDHWLKEIAPSDSLRKDFHQEKDNFSEFKKKYKKELSSGEQKEALEELKNIIKETDRKI